MAEKLLQIQDLHVEVEGKEILRGLDLELDFGQIHAIMGPNGSGKSTLAYVLTGRPGYVVTGGRVLYKGEDILALAPDERAQRGIFLAFQYPTEVPGVSVVNFTAPLTTRRTPMTRSRRCSSVCISRRRSSCWRFRRSSWTAT